jgi:hypothetical protein
MIKVSFRTCHFYFKRFNRILLLIRNPANHFLERRAQLQISVAYFCSIGLYFLV